jgi:hypothetical protein
MKKVFRFYAKKVNADKWQACCIDLNIVAEGKTFEYVRSSMETQIKLYLCEAKSLEDLKKLVPRPAPLSYHLEYYLSVVLVNFFHSGKSVTQIFKEGLDTFLNNNTCLRHA